MKVIIDGITYVPLVEIPQISDPVLKSILEQLVTIQYLGESHKAMAHAWEVLNTISPQLAELTTKDSRAALELVESME